MADKCLCLYERYQKKKNYFTFLKAEQVLAEDGYTEPRCRFKSEEMKQES
jgi:hypothetical protein